MGEAAEGIQQKREEAKKLEETGKKMYKAMVDELGEEGQQAQHGHILQAYAQHLATTSHT